MVICRVFRIMKALEKKKLVESVVTCRVFRIMKALEKKILVESAVTCRVFGAMKAPEKKNLVESAVKYCALFIRHHMRSNRICEKYWCPQAKRDRD